MGQATCLSATFMQASLFTMHGSPSPDHLSAKADWINDINSAAGMTSSGA
jgi:hypothetical protein